MVEEALIKELNPVGKYKVRILKGRTKSSKPVLDIREYISSDSFTGFTRRGIRVDKEGLATLRAVCEAAEAAWPKEA